MAQSRIVAIDPQDTEAPEHRQLWDGQSHLVTWCTKNLAAVFKVYTMWQIHSLDSLDEAWKYKHMIISVCRSWDMTSQTLAATTSGS